MSAPAGEGDDLVQGCVKWLTELSEVVEAVGAAPVTGDPWIFQHSLWVTVEGSSSSAAVLSCQGGWASPNRHNSMRFPRLGLEIYVDPLRDPGGNLIEPGETHRRLDYVYRSFDTQLHRPAGDTVFWGALRVISSTRLIEPVSYPVPDGGGMLRLQTFYGVTEA